METKLNELIEFYSDILEETERENKERSSGGYPRAYNDGKVSMAKMALDHLQMLKGLTKTPQSTSLLNQIEALKKENERARELLKKLIDTHRFGAKITSELQSFLNEQK